MPTGDQDPDDLAPLPKERHRQLARAMIAAAEADQRMEVYKVRLRADRTVVSIS